MPRSCFAPEQHSTDISEAEARKTVRRSEGTCGRLHCQARRRVAAGRTRTPGHGRPGHRPCRSCGMDCRSARPRLMSGTVANVLRLTRQRVKDGPMVARRDARRQDVRAISQVHSPASDPLPQIGGIQPEASIPGPTQLNSLPPRGVPHHMPRDFLCAATTLSALSVWRSTDFPDPSLTLHVSIWSDRSHNGGLG